MSRQGAAFFESPSVRKETRSLFVSAFGVVALFLLAFLLSAYVPSAGAVSGTGGPALEKAFAFGANWYTQPVSNAPETSYVKVVQFLWFHRYRENRGYGYTELGAIDRSPNNRNVFKGRNEIYDQFIGAKGASGAIIFRVDVPNGVYRFVAAGGDAKYGNHSTTIRVRDGASGETVTLVENFENPRNEFYRVGFEGREPPPAGKLGPKPNFSTPVGVSPALTVTEGYLEVHQIVGAGFEVGGDLSLLEIWNVSAGLPPDTTPPVVTAPPPLTLTSAVPVPASDPAIQTFLAAATAFDDRDGALTPTHDAPSEFPIGDTVVTFRATDAANNTGTAQSTVTVEVPPDMTPPVVTAPPPLTLTSAVPVPASDPAIQTFLAAATAFDDRDGALTPTHDAPSEFPIGVTVVTFRATDAANNTGTAQSTVTVELPPSDVIRPLITATLDPPPGPSGWNTTEVTVSFVCSDAGSGIATCSDPMTVSAEGVTEVTGIATDNAGNTATRRVTVRIDFTSPQVEILCPISGSTQERFVTSVSGTISDVSGAASVTCSSGVDIVEAVLFSNAGFACKLPLAPGANTIVVQAQDKAGNPPDSASVGVDLSPPAALPLGVVPGRNVNIVAGTEWPFGDPFLQRQNEPSLAVSTRNPLHLVSGTNDYRTVDLPGLPDEQVTGDAWLGVFKSFDGGLTWRSTLLPGYPQDTSTKPNQGPDSPLYGLQAAADPVVRVGTNGLFYYSGIAFDRGENVPSTVFVARYLDLNNKEAGDPIEYVDTILLDSRDGATTEFIDKPWLAVDVPRTSSSCTFTIEQEVLDSDGNPTIQTVNQTIPAGNVYVAYTIVEGVAPSLTARILFSRSTDCGATFSAPTLLSPSGGIHQGSSIAVDPGTGHVYVAWRRFASGADTDAIFVARSTDGGASFEAPALVTAFTPFQQGTAEVAFRTNAFPTMAIDDLGRVYVAWAQRVPPSSDGRIVLSTFKSGEGWSPPIALDNHPGRGHQFMPALTFNAGHLTLVYYDQRDDHTIGQLLRPDQCALIDDFLSQREAIGDLADGNIDKVFNTFLIDRSSDPLDPLQRRHTIDLRAVQFDRPATLGELVLEPSIPVSEYVFGSRPGSTLVEQLQVNAPNLPLFRLGTAPFLGDYIDVAGSPPFVADPSTGTWSYNVDSTESAIFHATWTDNRDVRPPLDGDWTNYTPVNSSSLQPTSLFDPSEFTPGCQVGQEGMRNQNVYTALLTEGLFAAAPGNSKPLRADIERGFVIWIQNNSETTRSYRLQILDQPVGGHASFQQAFPSTPGGPLVPNVVDQLDVSVARRSSVARTVYVASTDPRAAVRVDVFEIDAPGPAAVPVPDGLGKEIVLNPDVSNPDVSNPDVSNPDVSNPDVSNAEVYTPDVSNPDVSNPDVSNPDVSNPDVSNPDVSNVEVVNPDVSNPDVSNPDVSNPDVSNPDVSNPDVSNPDVSNTTISDTSWTFTNTGNTTAAFTVAALLNAPVPPNVTTQLILHKVYTTPVAYLCQLRTETQNILLANILNPKFTTNPAELANPDVSNPDVSNASLWLAPGDSARVTLRVFDYDPGDGVTFVAAADVTPALVAHAVNTEAAAAGITTPTVSIAFTVITRSPAPGTVGNPYSQFLTAIGGEAPLSWSLIDGALPPGIDLDPTTGELFGLPTSTGEFVFTVEATESSARNKTDIQEVRLVIGTPGGLQPVADAGPNQVVAVGSTVFLDGTGSSDPDDLPLDYSWILVPPVGSAAALSSVTAVDPSFTADIAGTYTATLTVDNGTLTSAPDFVTIRTGNTPPQAAIAAPPTALVGSVVALSGAGSFDLDLDPLTYSWAFVSRPSGSRASISNPSAEATSFVPDSIGVYQVQLVVTDTMNASGSATFDVNVVPVPVLSINPNVLFTREDSPGFLLLSVPAGPGGVTVHLSTPGSLVSVQPTVVVPEGATVAIFALSSGVSAGSTTIDASAPGFVSGSGDVTVILRNYSFHVPPIVVGQTVTASVQLISAAPAGGATLSLSVDDPSIATLPSSVTVPEGAASSTFEITGLAGGTTNLNADGLAAGYETRTVGLTVSHALAFQTAQEGLPDLFGVATNGTLYVAVGDGGSIVSSVTGFAGTWSKRVNPDPHKRHLRRVTFANGQFVAVGVCCGTGASEGVVLTSPTGIDWTLQDASAALAGRSLVGVGFGGGLYVAVGTGGRIVTSGDGVTWTARTSGTTSILRGVAFGAGTFVAVGDNRTVVTSPDGIDWTVQAGVPAQIHPFLRAVTFTGSLFVAVAFDGGNVMTSPDGIAWTVRATPNSTALYDVTTGGGLVAAVGHFAVLTSSDNGVTWTERQRTGAVYVGSFLRGVTFRAGTGFLAVGEEGEMYRSPNGTDPWNSETIAQSRDFWDVAWDGNRFCAVGGSRAVAHSLDGENWTNVTTLPSDAIEMTSVTWNGGVFVAVGYWLSGAIATSPDCENWTLVNLGTTPETSIHGNLWEVSYANGLFVAVGSEQTATGASTWVPLIATSPDGTTWTERPTGLPTDGVRFLNTVAFGNGRFVGIGGNDAGAGERLLLTSDDGVTWTSQPNPFGDFEYVADLVFADGLFVLVGDSIWTSPDGLSWTDETGFLPFSTFLNGVSHGFGRFLAVGSPGIILSSTDGTTWLPDVSSPSSHDYQAVHFAPELNRFVAVGDSIIAYANETAQTLADRAVIDSPSGVLGSLRQLDTQFATATDWEWAVVVRPAGSTAALSATDVKNPTFTPDVLGNYVFRLVASSTSGVRVSTVSLFGGMSCAGLAPPDVPPAVCSGAGASISLTFVNQCADQTVDLYWVDFSCNEVFTGRLLPGASLVQQSFVTHPFRFRRAPGGALLKDAGSFLVDSVVTVP